MRFIVVKESSEIRCYALETHTSLFCLIRTVRGLDCGLSRSWMVISKNCWICWTLICWWFFEAGNNSLTSRLNSIVSMSLIRANVAPGISVLKCQQKPLGIVYRTLGMVYCSRISTYVHVFIKCCEKVTCGIEWCSVVFIDETRFYLYASDGHLLILPGEWHLTVYIYL